jgi:hypothetical protein
MKEPGLRIRDIMRRIAIRVLGSVDWITDPALDPDTDLGLPDGHGQGRITQNRQYKNISGHGKLP